MFSIYSLLFYENTDIIEVTYKLFFNPCGFLEVKTLFAYAFLESLVSGYLRLLKMASNFSTFIT